MLMNIWVRDNGTGHVHQVGTDPHDSLDSLYGKVEYYNLQKLHYIQENLYHMYLNMNPHTQHFVEEY